MKKLMITAVLAGALASVAADATYTWTSGATSLGDGAVTIAYLSGNNITNLTVNPTDGGTITINGELTFAADATITLATSGTVSFASKVTTQGALTLARGDDAYIVWTGSSAMTDADAGVLVSADLTRDDVDFVALIPAASSAAVRSPYTYVSGPNESGFYVFNRVTSSYVYSARVQLMDKSNGLCVRCRTGLRSPRLGLYPDEEDSWATESLWDKWSGKTAPVERGWYGRTGDTQHAAAGSRLDAPSALGFNKIILRRKGKTGKANVRFEGGASFGGTATIDAGVEAVWVASASEYVTLSKSIAGDGDLTVIPPPNVPNTVTMLGYVSHLEWKVLARNRLLKDVKKITGYMQGTGHNALPTGIPSWCNGYFFETNATGDEATCQFQCARNSTSCKCVDVQLKQEGNDILIKGVGYVLGSAKAGKQKEAMQYSRVSYWDEDQGKYTYSGYGICDVTVYFDDTTATAYHGGVLIDYDFNGGDLSGLVGGKFTIDGSGSDLPMYVRVSSKTGFPYSGEVHVNGNSFLHLSVTNTSNSAFISSSSSKLVIHEDGVVRSGVDDSKYNWQLGGSQEMVLAGGKLVPFSVVGHMNYVTFSNAVQQSVTSSGGLRFDATRAGSSWHVIGDQPSAVTGNGVNVYGTSSAATARNSNYSFRVNVTDVAEGVDFTVPRIRAASDRASGRESFAWFMFEKYGRGTMALTGDAKEVRLESKLFGGTLLLAGDNIMTNAVVLAGGNLAVDAGMSNSLGNLTANTNGTLKVGAGGSLSFASFTAGEGLQAKAIMIDAPLTNNVLRFGTDDTALQSAQRNYFRWRDPTDETVFYRVKVDEQGYVHPRKNGTAVVVK